MFKKIISFLFGNFTWIAPLWAISLKQHIKAHPRQYLRVGFITIIIGLATYFAYQWFERLPKPEQIIAELTPPKMTPIDKILVPDTLKINFGVAALGSLRSRSVAPINLVGQVVKEGVTLTPSLEGTWVWQSDSQLAFIPSKDWPAAQEYKVHFAKDFFSKNVHLATDTYYFSTLPFSIVINDFKFYQDPVNAQVRQVVATIQFSYPVDTNSLDDKISLYDQSSHKKYKFTISFDDNKRTAYLHSESLKLNDTARYIDLKLAKGIKPIAGDTETTDVTKSSVLVPDMASYFKINSVSASIIRNQNDLPEQVLLIETSVGMTNAEIEKNLHVYLLPKDYPKTKTQDAVANYNWNVPGEVTADILKLATPVELHPIPTEHDYATLHSYRLQANTPSYIYVKINKGTMGFGDVPLANDYMAIVPTPVFPQEITFLHKGALLALGSEEKLSVLVRGLKAVKFDYARVLPNDINHLITQTGGDYSNPSFENYNFNQNNISQISSEIKEFAADDLAKAQYTALDLAQYVAKSNTTGGPRGLFLLQAHGWDVATKSQTNGQASRLILITDLGILTKNNADGTHDVFVQSIMKGSPVSNASVSVLGKNGIAIATVNTDNQGHAHFNDLTEFTNEKEPTVYIAHLGDDVSFMPYNRSDRLLNYSRFEVGGETSDAENQAALTAFVFTERGIYRPGDLVHIGIIVKKPYILPQSQGLPLEMEILDARGTVVKTEKLSLNQEGLFDISLPTNSDSPTGRYYINVYIVKDNYRSSLIGSGNFNVAEFLPDRMKISAKLSSDNKLGWVNPDDLSATITLTNLYGTPAASHRIGGKIILAPQRLTFSEFKNYVFMDPLFDAKSPPKVFNDTLADVTTNDEGEAKLNLKLDRFDKATYELTLLAEGFEPEGGRSVTTQVKALVSPLHYLVGFKAVDNLNYIKENAAQSVNLIAIDPTLKQIALDRLQVKLYKLQPVTTLIKNDDGTYQYQSLIQSNLVQTQPLTISATGTEYTLPTSTVGDYQISVVDENGLELSKFKYNIVGNSQQALPKNAELNVKLNKAQYAPGEEIEIQVTAPYIGSGLITIERDKVYSYQWFKADTTTSVQKIKIPADFQGNGYVNVAFVRDINSPEIFINPLSYSVMPFAVTHDDRNIQVDLTVPEKVLPNDTLTIQYKTDKPSKIIIFAVDEGILQVSKYVTPNPVAYFFQKRALEVNTMQIVDQILPKFMADRELSAVGGDGAMNMLAKNLNPFKRKTDLPVVYWSGILDADATQKSVEYVVPDYFNGTLRVMAIAVKDDAIGIASKDTQVRGHFVINPNAPTFVAPNDEFDVSVGVANNVENSGKDAIVTVALTQDDKLTLLNDAKQTITIPENGERSVHFKFKAKAILGDANLKITASLGDKSSQFAVSMSVRPPIAYSATLTSGFVKSADHSLKINKSFYAEYRKVQASASKSPMILLVGLNEYLEHYPYGCTEQLVSKTLPLMAMAKDTQFAQNAHDIKDKIDFTIQMLAARQLSNGSISYWPSMAGSMNESDNFATLYALHFLTEANEQGYTVPNNLMSNGVAYLKEFVTRDVTNLDEARMQAYAIYLLTRQELVTTNYLTHLLLTLDNNKNIKWKNDITSVYIAATYQLLKNDTEALKMLQYFKPENSVIDNDHDFYSTDIANAEYLYLIAKHFPAHLAIINADILPNLVKALNAENISTVLSGFTTMALSAYAATNTVADNTLIAIKQVNQNQQTETLAASTGYSAVNISADAKQIIFDNPNKTGYFYLLSQAGFDKQLPSKTISDGIEITREYRTVDNTAAVSNAHLGDEIAVHVRIRAIDNLSHSNVAIVDLLPGGFEILRDSVQATQMEYSDIREDRVIFFGYIPAEESIELTYHMKATNIGKYIVPPIFAGSMYNPRIQSQGLSGSITVSN